MKFNTIKYLFVLILFSLFSLKAFSSPVAMIMDFNGQVSINAESPQLLAELKEGQSIVLGPKSTITVVYLSSGDEFKLTGPSKATLGKEQLLSEDKLKKNKTILASVSDINTHQFSQAAIVMRSASEQKNDVIELISPKSTKVLTKTPTFSWNSVGSGYNYRVEILSESGDSIYVLETKKNSFKLPSNIELPEQQLLSWEIEAYKANKTLYSIADFSVADKKEIDLVESQRPSDNAPFSRLLLFAWSIEKRGLIEEAQIYWKKLATIRPDDEVIKSKLN